MRDLIGKKTVLFAAKSGCAFLALLLAVSVCIAVFKADMVNADSQVVISAVTRSSDIGPGDIIIVDVVANHMPGITEFGPVRFNYDADQAEFVAFDQGKELTNYAYTETQTKGELIVSGMDQMMSVGTDENGEETISASFASEEQVVLFTVTLRIYPNGSGDINCWISECGSFTSPEESVSVSIGSGVTLPIKRGGLSSNATLSSLKVRGASITPEFNPNITEYTCSVELSVTEVQVSVIESNSWAAVSINGNQYLNVGDNTVTVDVTAQDGINRMHYTIHVVRRESNIPDNALLVDVDGNTYTFLDAPEEAVIPEGFSQTTRYINGYSVPAYIRDGVTSVLIYLYDGTQSPGFYFYNSTAKTVIKYEPENTIIETSQILKSVEVPDDVMIPEEFKPAIFDNGTMLLNGYLNDDGDFILYLADENGFKDFYRYNQTDGTVSTYRFADKKAELLYSYLFDVFLVIAIIEAVIITITVYIIRRMVSDRTSPRPKRV